MKIAEQIVVFRDEQYYSAFPSIVCLPDGELLTAFRRAPERRRFKAPGITHTDPNSMLMLVRSMDGGQTWSEEPELVCAHPLGGSQDPCMVLLRDGSLVVTSYLWMLIPGPAVEHAARSSRIYDTWPFVSMGGYLVRSTDRGHSWAGPIVPPEVPGQAVSWEGVPRPALNRGAMVEGRDGNLYWAVAGAPAATPDRTAIDLLVSADGGLSWRHAGPIAADDEVVFNETSLIETPAGDLVAFVRTSNFGDHGVLVRSHDHGSTWEPWQDMGIIGHPYHALRLPDERVYVIYGYRHQPFGIRARIFDPECRQFESDELVLRADGGNGDVGYPWACLTADGRVLSVYYINQADGPRYIGGTFVDLD